MDLAVAIGIDREDDASARAGDDLDGLKPINAYDVDRAEVDRILARLDAALAEATLIGESPLGSSAGVARLAQADEQMYEHNRARKAAAP